MRNPFRRTQYDDGQLCTRAEKALAADAMVPPNALHVTSEDGIVTLHGGVHSDLEKRHALEAVRSSFEVTGLEYQRIEDRITVL
ncbi:MAG: BON domain-containing protein [Chloroflexota bacterium]|nr:BON domain-containing protein [Chloroflexota bacterium]